MHRRQLVLSFCLIAAALPAAAVAKDGMKFTDAAFKAAQAEGKPILIDVTAPWCPTCKAQAPLIEFMLTDPALKNMVRLNVDFDSMKDTLKFFNASKQSTLIVFKGKTEVGRSTGDTTAAGIESLLRKAI